MTTHKPLISNVINATVIVAGLGYFVDIYDLQLFNIIGKESIKSSVGLNIADEKVVTHLFDNVLFLWQMAGMLFGGLLWGILGDKKGRKSILFGSILLYSLANIANAFVTTLPAYEAVRFLAGLGLAGELGAAITLVSEVMTKENRGYGTMIIVVLGALGAVVAAFISKMRLSLFGLETWQTAYLIGGSLGLLLLFLRFGTFESGMFEKTQAETVQKGNFFMLFSQKERFLKYLACILVGLPVWYTIGILIKFANSKFIPIIGILEGKIEASYPIMFAYIGLSTGDLLSGLLSQWFKSRKKVVIGFLIANFILACIFVFMREVSANFFYFFCFLLGSATGYWALFVTIASEQFGTNIRATATSTVPNFVRGAVIPITLGFSALASNWTSPNDGTIYGALTVGLICTILALMGIFNLKETFGKDLNYSEMQHEI